MNILTNFLILFFVFPLTNNILSQQISKNTVEDVYVNIINAIGNSNPRPPTLIISQSNGNPASYSPKKKTISVEEDVLKICHSFGADSLNALSYILSHELGHHYRHHGWTTQYASLDFSPKDDKEKLKIQKRIENEAESDIFAGFYSHIAGYDALSVASEFLERIYQEYNLPDSIVNYPTLTQRKKIIQNNISDFEELRNVFKLANLTMSFGEYKYASVLYKYIINNGFFSREVYNNLGLCGAYRALDLNFEVNKINLLIPFELDLNSRLETRGSTRNIDNEDQRVIQLLNDALSNFELATKLDPMYEVAKKNAFYTKIALSYLNAEISIDIDQIDDLGSVCSFCIKGHLSKIRGHNKKSMRLFRLGSKTCDVCSINSEIDSRKLPVKNQNLKTEFDDLMFNDIDMNCKRFSPRDCQVFKRTGNIKICISDSSDISLYRCSLQHNNKSSCLGIIEIRTVNDSVKNKLNIYVNDPESKIWDNFKNIRIINAGDMKYISVVESKLTFLIEGEKIIRWYYLEKLN